jgi:hypothetical protein
MFFFPYFILRCLFPKSPVSGLGQNSDQAWEWRRSFEIKDIQGVPRRKVNFLGGHSIGHSKQKIVHVPVLFRTVSEIELFHCTVTKLLIRKRYMYCF